MVKKGRSLSNVAWPSVSTGPGTRHVPKIGRNDKCPCGSGKKYKDCHQNEGDAFLQRLAKEEEKKRVRETRERLKAEGVPWWKRLLLIGR